MERLTNRKEAEAQQIAYDRRIRQGYPRNIPEERFLRLAAWESLFEDTGLTPDELPRAAELVKAEREGLCVVLDGPRKPLIWDDDHEAIRCAYCGTDLMGIRYSERMILQCPECGQYIDGTKAITRAEAEAALGGGGNG